MVENQTVQIHGSSALREMLLKAGYSAKAIDYYIRKPYMGVLQDADQISEMTGSCGDTMRVYLKVTDGRIADVRYEVFGCAGAVSSAMAAVDLVRGKRTEEAARIDDRHVYRALGEIPVEKHHCIQLAVKALRLAIDNYQNGGGNGSASIPN